MSGDGISEAIRTERARIVASLRKEGEESAGVVETMLQSEYHAGLRGSSRRWAEIAQHAGSAAHAFALAKHVEGGYTVDADPVKAAQVRERFGMSEGDSSEPGGKHG